MTTNYTTTPPTFAKDAKPSKLGWHDKSTGELLVSNRNINPDLYAKKNIKVEKEVKVVKASQTTIKKKVVTTKKKVTKARK